MSKDHIKHTKLTHPETGNYGRFEIAVSGLNCYKLSMFSVKILKLIKDQYNVIYLDEKHGSSKHNNEVNTFVKRNEAATLKMSFNNNSFQNKLLFYDYDLLLLNGNHFDADQNIIIVDEQRIDKLISKAKNLSKISAVVLTSLSYELPEQIKDLIEKNNATVFVINEVDKIADFIIDQIRQKQVQINGLVLSGGLSKRMGSDKGNIKYFDKEHKFHLAEMIRPYCTNTFLSYSTPQKEHPEFKSIVDEFNNLGPMSAILTAFKNNPNTAWLVIACDLPLLKKETIEQLLAERDASKIATAFVNEENGFPEPLATIWEPKSYRYLLNFLALGYTCPRKVLINSDTNLIKAQFPESLQNVNSKKESNAILNQIKRK